ncbi:MAG: hypothetical protein IPL70_11840 [Uliginosibacterium sp.]|nr:hypothetical protein [Uliginosibacterium sp.]
MRILLFANTDWFLFNFKRSLARALRAAGHELVLLESAREFASACATRALTGDRLRCRAVASIRSPSC